MKKLSFTIALAVLALAQTSGAFASTLYLTCKNNRHELTINAPVATDGEKLVGVSVAADGGFGSRGLESRDTVAAMSAPEFTVTFGKTNSSSVSVALKECTGKSSDGTADASIAYDDAGGTTGPWKARLDCSCANR